MPVGERAGECIPRRVGGKVGTRSALILTIAFGTTVLGPGIGAVRGTLPLFGGESVGG